MRNHIHDQLEIYLAREMDPFTLRAFEGHAAGCRSCARAVRDAQQAQSYLRRLTPTEAPPQPGPDFYLKVQRAIEEKPDSGRFGNLAAVLHGPRLAFPLVLLVLGLVLSVWTVDAGTDWMENGVFGIPPARFSDTIMSEADRNHSRDMVMVSLIDE